MRLPALMTENIIMVRVFWADEAHSQVHSAITSTWVGPANAVQAYETAIRLEYLQERVGGLITKVTALELGKHRTIDIVCADETTPETPPNEHASKLWLSCGLGMARDDWPTALYGNVVIVAGDDRTGSWFPLRPQEYHMVLAHLTNCGRGECLGPA